MKYNFRVTLLGGEKIPDMDIFRDQIADIVFDCTDKDDVTIECDGFSVYEELTINEILTIEKKLVEIGLIIKP